MAWSMCSAISSMSIASSISILPLMRRRPIESVNSLVCLVGIGSNLAAPGYQSPQDTARAAVAALPTIGVAVVARSPWYLSEPVPASDQPWFANGVVVVTTELPPPVLLARLLALEARFGRE